MSALLRDASPALVAALAGGVKLWSADLFTFGLADGVTTYNFASWDSDLTVGDVVYASRKPWITRSGWNVTNTLEVPTLTLKLSAMNDGFAGGANIKTQIHNGLFDGASFLLARAFMTTPGDTADLGLVDLFGGEVGAIDITGAGAQMNIKGKVNKLDQYVPRNLFQVGCNHAFCDLGCTLNRAAYTSTFAVGADPTPTFVPWASPSATPALYTAGTLAITSGAGAGQRRTILAAASGGVTLAYPLYIVPAPGDTFTGFEGCDKTENSASGQSCADRSNTQHYRGFEFIPPPNAAY